MGSINILLHYKMKMDAQYRNSHKNTASIFPVQNLLLKVYRWGTLLLNVYRWRWGKQVSWRAKVEKIQTQVQYSGWYLLYNLFIVFVVLTSALWWHYQSAVRVSKTAQHCLIASTWSRIKAEFYEAEINRRTTFYIGINTHIKQIEF